MVPPQGSADTTINKNTRLDEEDILVQGTKTTATQLIIDIFLPFLSKKDIHVRASDNGVDIYGKVFVEKEYRKGDMRSYDKTQRLLHKHVLLPCAVDRESLKTHYDDGMLTITLNRK